MKTNKSFAKRLKRTKSSKLLAQKPGRNHFNAKAPRAKQLARKKMHGVRLTRKTRVRFLEN